MVRVTLPTEKSKAKVRETKMPKSFLAVTVSQKYDLLLVKTNMLNRRSFYRFAAC